MYISIEITRENSSGNILVSLHMINFDIFRNYLINIATLAVHQKQCEGLGQYFFDQKAFTSLFFFLLLFLIIIIFYHSMTSLFLVIHNASIFCFVFENIFISCWYDQQLVPLIFLEVTRSHLTFSNEEDMCSNCKARPSDAWPRPAGLKSEDKMW